MENRPKLDRHKKPQEWREWKGACAKETFKMIKESNISFQGPCGS